MLCKFFLVGRICELKCAKCKWDLEITLFFNNLIINAHFNAYGFPDLFVAEELVDSLL